MKKLVKLTSDFTNAKVGDKVASINCGCGTIIKIDKTDKVYPIKTSYDKWFTIDGKYYEHHKYPSLFNGHHENLVMCAEVEEEAAPLQQKELDLEILLKEYIKAKQTLETVKQQIKDIVE